MAHLLVIDDAADLRLLMRMALQSAGHTITDADGGVEGLRALDHQEDIDLVVLDVQMPVVDGWDVLSRLRQHPVHHDVPVLMCTVKFSHDDLIHAWELGCDGYLNKPFDLNELAGMTSSILSTDDTTRARRRRDTLIALRAARAEAEHARAADHHHSSTPHTTSTSRTGLPPVTLLP